MLLFIGASAPMAATAASVTTISESELKSTIAGIINWKKLDNGSATNGYLINDKFLLQAGTTPGDWFPISLGRYGYADDYQAYRAVIADVVSERYKTPEKLDKAKATEWHRISLAVLAMGGDPRSIGKGSDGKPINLIADGTYNRGKTVSLGRQGINGWIWGLITVDSMRYEIPSGAFYSRDDIILEILQQQLSDGGFALTGKNSDPDITGMTLQAFAPYYNNDKEYTYTQKATKQTVTKTVRQVADEAISWLSSVQTNDGDFKSWGMQNVESTCQAVVALCSYGINPENDPRFIKNGKTLIDGILKYKMPDGGFIHSFTYDAENPTSLPDKSNSMATEQVLYTLTALYRFKNNMRMLYDFRPEWNTALKNQINDVKSKIDALPTAPKKSAVESVFNAYKSLPATETCYVYNFGKLMTAMKTAKVENDSEDVTKNTGGGTPSTPDKQTSSETGKPNDKSVTQGSGKTDDANPSDNQNGETTAELPDDIDLPILFFSLADREAVSSLPSVLTTEHYVLVVKLLDKLQNSDEFEGKADMERKLIDAKDKIALLQNEIDDLNQIIMDQLYPFDKIGIFDREKIYTVVSRYNALSQYDQAKILRWEDVIKTKTKIDNLIRGLLIGAVLLIIASCTTVVIVLRIKKRRAAKRLAMEALAAEYKDDDE